MTAPVAYLVAERRDGRWIIGDDWSPEFATLDEAQTEAQKWRDGVLSHSPEDVAVLAVTVVPPTPEACAWVLFPASRIDPAETCEDDAEPGSEFCARHGALADA